MIQSRLKFLGNPSLETERVKLRKISIADENDIFAYARLPEVSRYVTWDLHKTIADTRLFIHQVLERYKKDEAGDWAVVLKDTGQVVGTAGFPRIDQPNFQAEVGYVLSRDYWGRGLMTEVLMRLICFAFEEMKLNRVEATHFPENSASGRVMQKAGMSYEGLLREKVLVKNNFQDLNLYAILKKEWMVQRDKK